MATDTAARIPTDPDTLAAWAHSDVRIHRVATVNREDVPL